MPWVMFDDQFPEHPKIDGLTDSAFRLHVAGICYSNRQLTDGTVPADQVRRLVPRFRRRALDELVARRLWIAVDGDYQIHDYLQWNKSRAEVLADRERLRKARSDAGKKGAAARWGTRWQTG